jgi:hydroxymethylpyrimidine/phosphomethylpyrimidine kinase
MRGRVLVVAGSDSGGGAGIQADIKTIMALGGFATTAVTALTAQNTLGVQGVLPLPPDFVRLQMSSVLDDIGADAVKTGMLGDAALIETVAEAIGNRGMTLVVDPVMVAKGGHVLLPEDAIAALKTLLIPLAAIITPNVPEAEKLLGGTIRDEADQKQAARALLALGAGAVLLKGGHLGGPAVTDILATEAGLARFTGARIKSRHTHGTGCTLASAIAVLLARGVSLADAVQRARAFVVAAIAAAPGLGGGHGPLNHAVWMNKEAI